MALLKLVGAKRYAHPKLGKDVILKGNTVEVTDPALVKSLLSERMMDGLNNEHKVFIKVREEEVEESEDEQNTLVDPEDSDDDAGDAGDETGEGGEEGEEGEGEEGSDDETGEGEDEGGDEDQDGDAEEDKGAKVKRTRSKAPAKGGKK